MSHGIEALIFSKNRAMQLDALLRSIDRFAPGMFARIEVLYLGTDQRHHLAYERLKRDRHDDSLFCGPDSGLHWTSEPNVPAMFDCFVGEIIKGAVRRERSRFCFLVDDDLFYRPAPDPQIPLDATCYSFRLGRNTMYCYPKGAAQSFGEGDFAYPFSLDGHVYRTAEVAARIWALPVSTNPNEFEDALWQSALNQTHRIIHGDHSCLVNIPHNLVGPYPNRHMGGTADELLDIFMAGWRIDLNAMDFSDVRAAHQEIHYKYKKAE